MKKLYLLRHAEAEKEGKKNDFERALTQFGRSQANLVGEYLKINNIIPDLILCSDAVRTRQTFDLINKVCCFPSEVTCTHALYNAHTDTLENQILNINEDVNSLMLIGHNPAITMLPFRFKLPEGKDAINGFDQTGRLVGLSFHKMQWGVLLTAPCQIINLFCPKP